MTNTKKRSYKVDVNIVKKKNYEQDAADRLEKELKQDKTAEPTPSKEETEDLKIPKAQKKVALDFRRRIQSLGMKHYILLACVVAFGLAVAALVVLGVERYSYRSDIPSKLPQNTIAAITLNVNPINAEVIETYGFMKDQFALDPLTTSPDLASAPFFGNRDITFESLSGNVKDEIGVAYVLSSGNLSENYIFISKSQQAAQNVLDNIFPGQQAERVEYKDETIFTSTIMKGDEPHSLSYVYVDGAIILSDDPSAPFAFVDVAKKDTASLAELVSFQELNSSLPKNAVAKGYLNLNDDALQSIESKYFRGSVILSALSAFSRDVELSFSLSVDDNSLLTDVIAPHDQKDQYAATSDFASLLPESVSAYMTGNDFRADIEGTENSLRSSNPILSFYFSNLERRLRDSFSFDLDNDFLQYFEGSYAVAVDSSMSRFKTTGKPFNNIAVILELTDVAGFEASEETIQGKLAEVLGSQFGADDLVFQEQDVDGDRVFALADSRFPVDLYYARVDEYVAISTDKDFIRLYQTSEISRVEDTESYQSLESVFDQNLIHAVYINPVLALDSEFLDDLNAKEIGESIDALSILEIPHKDFRYLQGVIHFAE